MRIKKSEAACQCFAGFFRKAGDQRCSWGTTRPASDGSVAWQRALDYFFKLNAENYLGRNDLHLPNFKEPGCLVNNSKPNTAAWLNNLGFINVQAGAY